MVIGVQRWWRAWLLAMLLGSTLAAQAAEPFSARDDQGYVLQLHAAPKRVVSLLPSLTETVCVLGA
ncbi:MAG: hypothetical protein KGI52_13575, partial [Burkholderiales bacterium]|nr:hypothetical protein [Burkholderiales bacterium]